MIEDTAQIVPPRSRNDRCPCGSGQRYKNCHGLLASNPDENLADAPQSLAQLMQAALKAQLAGSLTEARDLYDAALKIDPDQPDALHMRGVVALSLNKPDEALHYIDRALARGLDNAATRHNRSLALEAKENFETLDSKVRLLEDAAASHAHQRDDCEFISPEDVGLLCYYLPQFHRVAENDEWWGLGFTEWTNVKKAQPLYQGHDQPRIPTTLGYYDLLDREVRVRQAELARAHGITGFCYYHYWFHGRRMLERPLDAVLASGDPDFPFCVFWANESWRRTWDGSKNETLIEQRHDAEDDIAFIDHLLPVFEDRRYIRVRGQPLLMVYRVDNLPKAADTFERWRERCIAHGEMPPYIVIAETLFHDTPLRYGADASVGFPPHRLNADWVREESIEIDTRFNGKLLDYRKIAALLAAENETDHLHYQCVAPRWDNSARRQFDGTIFANATPALFTAWLRDAFVRARRDLPAGQRFVFLNAWNEWAEGAYLEPDEFRGDANLKAAWNARFVEPGYARIRDRLKKQ
jgi:hypothetical protein